jgi:hypothetical protein
MRAGGGRDPRAAPPAGIIPRASQEVCHVIRSAPVHAAFGSSQSSGGRMRMRLREGHEVHMVPGSRRPGDRMGRADRARIDGARGRPGRGAAGGRIHAPPAGDRDSPHDGGVIDPGGGSNPPARPSPGDAGSDEANQGRNGIKGEGLTQRELSREETISRWNIIIINPYIIIVRVIVRGRLL